MKRRTSCLKIPIGLAPPCASLLLILPAFRAPRGKRVTAASTHADVAMAVMMMTTTTIGCSRHSTLDSASQIIIGLSPPASSLS